MFSQISWAFTGERRLKEPIVFIGENTVEESKVSISKTIEKEKIKNRQHQQLCISKYQINYNYQNVEQLSLSIIFHFPVNRIHMFIM